MPSKAFCYFFFPRCVPLKISRNKTENCPRRLTAVDGRGHGNLVPRLFPILAPWRRYGNEVVVMDDRGSLHILQLIEWRLIEDDRV